MSDDNAVEMLGMLLLIMAGFSVLTVSLFLWWWLA